MCRDVVGPEHSHVADLQAQRLLCACRACYLLFTGEGSGGGRFRALPETSRHVPDAVVDGPQWEALQIPVDVAFLFRSTGSDGWTACYPSPGGATESLLDLASWADVIATNPVLDTVQPDVEAVLLRRQDGVVRCWLVPIDACYALVGLVRRDWSGFSGGSKVWAAIDAFFADLQTRSRTVARHPGASANG